MTTPVPPDIPAPLSDLQPGIFSRLASAVANEPIVHIVGTLQSAAIWAYTFITNGGDPSTHQEQIAGLATGLAFGISLIARQFVKPTRKG